MRLLLLTLAACLVFTAGAHAAKLPPGYVGMQVDGPLIDGGTDLDKQIVRMRKTGVRSVRFSIYWSDEQPYATMADVPAAKRARFVDVGGVPTDFSDTDKLVGAAAAQRLRILPVVLRAPVWARADPDKEYSPPSASGRAAYAAFLKALIERYGPGGTFLKANDYLPSGVIHDWQVWNEPNGPFFWNVDTDGSQQYVDLLKAAYPAVKAADPKAQVIAAGLFGKSWAYLRKLYKQGAKGFFDAVAIHPFTHKPAFVIRIAQYVRRVMRRHGDAKLPLIISELSWPSSQGKSTKIKLDFDTTEAGQAVRLRRAMRKLAGRRRELRLRAVFWSTWMTHDSSRTYPFDYSGLLTLKPDGSIVPKPAFAAFRKIVKIISR
ncbi:MAG: polysaccharide biosynthesis protein PslG [Solirubrobacteraceae bacterium]|jgi:hypothetical protein|nr:polysaccharide biosynthesis protein PslG [Solirubrobacteraceae bacterium]